MNRTLRRTLLALILMGAFATAGFSQDTDLLFPQFVNGQAGGGTSYSSAIHVLPYFTDPGTVTCTVRFWGMMVHMGTLGVGDTFTFTLQQAGGWALLRTNPAAQNLVSGYATLTCSALVYAYVDYAFYGPSGKIGGATVFDSDEQQEFRFIADQAEPGARLGIAIANNTDVPRTYNITVRNAAGQTLGTGQMTVAGRRSSAKFLDEVVSGTGGAVSHVLVRASDSSAFGAVGLRFVGSSFSTLPASW